MTECTDCQPIRKANDELLREIKELEVERDQAENKLHKADIQIGRLRAEINELRAKNRVLETPRFSNG